MKHLLPILAIVILPFAVLAQDESTNAPLAAAVTAANAARTNTTEIFSDHVEFQMKTNIAIYTGHVRVIDPRLNLTCDALTIRVPKSEGRPDYILAEQNVVIDAKDKDGHPVHATGDKATYTFHVENSVTNEVLVLSGNPFLKSEMFTGTGDPITWDLAKGGIYAEGPIHMTLTPPVKNPSTNAPAPVLIKTNTP
jgi:lipopolysaccharide transport protein LptA